MNKKYYCGNSLELPPGYDEFGSLYKCLQIGYGICKYHGHEGEFDNGQPYNPPPIKTYCGTKKELPEGYHSFATRYRCLQKGFGLCQHSKNKSKMNSQWTSKPKFLSSFFKKYASHFKTISQWNLIIDHLNLTQKTWIYQSTFFKETDIPGIYYIKKL
jgi:hypothetical protein